MKILDQSFYSHNDVAGIARDLLGKVLVTNINGKITTGIIVETEAYRGPDDRACHAYNNKHTLRTSTMFLEGGIAYVYICYGMQNMFNVVTSSGGNAHAVLIRAIEPILGIPIMLERRSHTKLKKETINGPGKLAQAMGINITHDKIVLSQVKNFVTIEDHGIKYNSNQLVSGARVGLSKKTGKDAHRPWRFHVKDNKYVSNPKVVTYPKEWLYL